MRLRGYGRSPVGMGYGTRRHPGRAGHAERRRLQGERNQYGGLHGGTLADTGNDGRLPRTLLQSAQPHQQLPAYRPGTAGRHDGFAHGRPGDQPGVAQQMEGQTRASRTDAGRIARQAVRRSGLHLAQGRIPLPRDPVQPICEKPGLDERHPNGERQRTLEHDCRRHLGHDFGQGRTPAGRSGTGTEGTGRSARTEVLRHRPASQLSGRTGQIPPDDGRKRLGHGTRRRGTLRVCYAPVAV